MDPPKGLLAATIRIVRRAETFPPWDWNMSHTGRVWVVVVCKTSCNNELEL